MKNRMDECHYEEAFAPPLALPGLHYPCLLLSFKVLDIPLLGRFKLQTSTGRTITTLQESNIKPSVIYQRCITSLYPYTPPKMSTSVNVNGIEFQPRLLINGEVGAPVTPR